MRYFLVAIILLLPVFSYGQTFIPTGSVTQGTYQRGGYAADSVFAVPVSDTIPRFVNYRNIGRITVGTSDSEFYYHNGTAWVKLITNADVPDVSQNLSDSNDNVVPSNGAVRRELVNYATTETVNAKQNSLSDTTILLALANDTNTRNDAGCSFVIGDSLISYYTHYHTASPDASPAEIWAVSVHIPTNTPSQPYLAALTPPGTVGLFAPSYFFKPNGDVNIVVNCRLNAFSDTSGRQAFYMFTRLASGGHTAPVELYRANGRITSAPDAIIPHPDDVGKFILAADSLVSGTGSSNTSVYVGVFLAIYDYGGGMFKSKFVMDNGTSSVMEPRITLDQRGTKYSFRNLDGYLEYKYIGNLDTFFNLQVYTKPQVMLQTQNAMHSIKFYNKKKQTIVTAIRYQGQNTVNSRRFIDLYYSDDAITVNKHQTVAFSPNNESVNQPTIHLDTIHSKAFITYSVTHGSGVYTDYYVKIIPLPLGLVESGTPITTGPMIVKNIYNNGTRNSNSFIQLAYDGANINNVNGGISNISNASASDSANGAMLIYQRGYNRTGLINLRATSNFPDSTGAGIVSNTNLGTKNNLAIADSINNALVAGTHNDFMYHKGFSNSYYWYNTGSYGINLNTKTFDYSVYGKKVHLTSNFNYDYDSTAFNMADSTLTDTSFAGQPLWIFDNKLGRKLIYGVDWRYENLSKIKFLTHRPNGSDEFYITTVAKWTDFAVIPPALDTLPGRTIASSFRKLRTAYTANLTARVTIGSTSYDIGFGADNYFDTLALKSYGFVDSCPITRWYKQDSTGGYMTVVNGWLKLDSGRVKITMNNGYMITNSNTTTINMYMHQARSAISMVGRINFANTSTVYGLYGNNGGTSSQRGVCALYDNRSAQSRTNAVFGQVSGGTFMVQNIANNSITPLNKFIYLANTNPAATDNPSKQAIYINNGTAIRNNTSTAAINPNPASYNFQIAAAGNNVAGMYGDVYEFIAFVDTLTNAQRTALYNNQYNMYVYNAPVATTLTLPSIYGGQTVRGSTDTQLQYGFNYTFTGNTATYVLPEINSGFANRDYTIKIKNAGTGNLTINTNGSSNVLYTTTLTNTMTIAPGEAYDFRPDGVNFNVE